MRSGKAAATKWVVAGILLVGVIVGILFVATNSEAKNQLTLATTRQPERLTELFFSNPTKIPSTASVGQSLPVSFAIRNLEAQNMSYHYRVSVVGASGTAVIMADAQVTIADTNSQTITQAVKLPTAPGHYEVLVQLLNKNQSVHFWVDIH